MMDDMSLQYVIFWMSHCQRVCLVAGYDVCPLYICAFTSSIGIIAPQPSGRTCQRHRHRHSIQIYVIKSRSMYKYEYISRTRKHTQKPQTIHVYVMWVAHTSYRISSPLIPCFIQIDSDWCLRGLAIARRMCRPAYIYIVVYVHDGHRTRHHLHSNPYRIQKHIFGSWWTAKKQRIRGHEQCSRLACQKMVIWNANYVPRDITHACVFRTHMMSTTKRQKYCALDRES